MRERKNFPTSGIFQTDGLASSYYLDDAAEKRYRYVRPAEYAQPGNCIADCWIVDKDGNINPGTNVSPVPVSRASIGRRIA